MNKDNKSCKIISDRIQEAVEENEVESTPRIETQDDRKSRNVSEEVFTSKVTALSMKPH